MMGAYSYTVSRFVPDQVRNEPVNIGVVVVDPDTGRVSHKFMDDLRELGPRCPGADLASLETIVGSISFEDMPGGADDMEKLARNHRYTLQFTPPRAVLAPSLKSALQRVFDAYVGGTAPPPSGPAVDEPAQMAPRNREPKEIVIDAIDAELLRCGVPREAVRVRPRFQGRHGTLVPDRGIDTEGGALALHAISFAGDPRAALRDAKVLAVDFEDARAASSTLRCTAVMDPAPDGSGAGGREAYEEAAGHLEDRGCGVVQADDMPRYARQIARLVPDGGARGPRRHAPPAAR